MSNDKKKYIESEWKSLLEITNMIDKDNRSYLDGVYGTRRQEAILKCNAFFRIWKCSV